VPSIVLVCTLMKIEIKGWWLGEYFLEAFVIQS
jgi:hypothetical protein